MTIIDVKKWQKRADNFLKKFTTSRSLILMYHRVAKQGIDPWALAVTPEHFAQHLDILKKHTQPISLRELALAHQQGKIPQRAVVITFDDGYADNLYNAKPILDKYQIPATVFIATGYTEKKREFWWDELDNIFFQPKKLPEKLSLKVNGKLHGWELGEAVNYTEVEQPNYETRAWNAQTGTRMYLYHSVWNQLLNLEEIEREEALNKIIEWANYQPIPRFTHRPMTPEELLILESSGWIEIGAHTINHPALPAHSVTTQKAEIEKSKAYLEKILGHPVTTFTYPFGAYNNQTRSIVKKAGFICACSTVEETVWKWCDRFLLPRFTVLDWDGAEFEKQLLQWFDQ